MIRINISDGSDGININHNKNGYLSVKKEGKIIFNGKADLSSGISIRVDKDKLEIGENESSKYWLGVLEVYFKVMYLFLKPYI